MLGINKPHYAKLCAKRMRDATGGSDVETNAMADEIVALLTDDKLDTNGVKKRSKSKKTTKYTARRCRALCTSLYTGRQCETVSRLVL